MSAVGKYLSVGPAVAVVVHVGVFDDRSRMVTGVVVDVVVDHLGLGKLQNDHGGRENHREKAEGECLPCFQGNQSNGQGDEGGRFDFQSE